MPTTEFHSLQLGFCFLGPLLIEITTVKTGVDLRWDVISATPAKTITVDHGPSKVNQTVHRGLIQSAHGGALFHAFR